MRTTLVELQRALAGEIGFNEDLDRVAHALFNGLLPPSWRALAPETRKSLGAWMVSRDGAVCLCCAGGNLLKCMYVCVLYRRTTNGAMRSTVSGLRVEHQPVCG